MAQSVKLTWQDNSDNETAFYIYRGAVSSEGEAWGPNVAVGTAPANTTEFVDVSVVPGTSYRYQVAAVNSAGSSQVAEIVVSVPVLVTVPAAPSALTAVVQG